MGAWGTGPFDNDDASDWAYELDDSSDLEVVRAALRVAAGATEYLEAPDGTTALAAAAVLDALRSGSTDDLPEEVVAWVGRVDAAVSAEDLALGARAVARVLGPGSEWRELWDEAGEADAVAGAEALQVRLSGTGT